VQDQAQRTARQATIKNRNVPPLRPGVVPRLADEFPQIEFVANVGIESLLDVKEIVDRGQYGSNKNHVFGTMVSWAVINCPCSFAVDDTLWGTSSRQ
jgi:hypothetical protein